MSCIIYVFNMKKALLLSFLIVFTYTFSIAQRGKDGAKVVTATESVNAYTDLIISAGAGNTIVNVTNTALNTNFSGNLAAGDLIMVYQDQLLANHFRHSYYNILHKRHY